jgi:regulatory protein YycH of two-component signal transduction system YycFG
MRDFQYSRSLRIISTVVLSFFIWTFGGAFDIAYAVKNDQQAEKRQSANSSQQSQKKITPPGLPLPQGEEM